MAISFPSSPSVNQTYTVGTKTWIWNGYAWDLQLTNTAIIFTQANSAYQAANSAGSYANSGYQTANSAGSYANGSFSIANSAATSANTKVSKSGDTMTGNLNLPSSNVTAQYVIVSNTLYSGLATSSATPLPNVIAQFTSNSNSYIQVNQQNINPYGSADYVVTADNGTDLNFYIDMGLLGSQYNNTNPNNSLGTAASALDGYLYVQGSSIGQLGGNLIMGTTGNTAGLETRIIAGGSNNSNIIMRVNTGGANINGNLIVSGGISNPFITAIAANATSAGSYANSSYAFANTSNTYFYGVNATQNTNISTATTNAAQASNIGATAGSYANSAFIVANNAFTSSNGALAWFAANSAGSYANSAYLLANASASFANTTFATSANLTIVGSYANSAYTQANTGNTKAQSSYDFANTSNTYLYGVNAYQNTAITTAGSYANSAYAAANNVTPQVQPAFNAANSAGSYANSAFQAANSAGSYANSAFVSANTSNTNAIIAGSYANSAYTLANTHTTAIASTGNYANAAYSLANASASYANTTFLPKSGGTITGSLTVSQDLTVSGNLTISGNTTQISANNLTINDTLIYLGANNTGNISDIGIVGHFTQGIYQHTGVVRDHNDGKWKFFSNVTPEPSGTNITFDANTYYDTVKVGIIETNASANIGSLTYVGTNFASPLGGATNPIIGGLNSSNNYVQVYVYNANNGINSSSDFVAYPINGNDTAGWIDVGITSNTFSQAAYSVTGPNEGYLFMSAPSGSSTSGNLVFSTDSTGTYNNMEFYVGGFGQGKGYPAAKLSASALTANSIISNGAVTVNTSTALTSTSYTTTTTSQVTVDSFTTASYRSAKYEIQITSGTSYHVTELRILHDGTNVYMAQYGEMITGSSLGTFDASISTGTLSLLFTPTNASTTVKIHRRAIVV